MPTEKQKRVAKKLTENPRKSVSRAMRESGYSNRSAEKPQDLTRSKGWQELMEEAFPDELLSAVHIGGLCAMKTISANVMVKSDDPTVRQRNATARDVDFIDVEDWPTRWTYLNGAYKLKGKYPAEEKKLEHSGKLTLAEFLADESDTA